MGAGQQQQTDKKTTIPNFYSLLGNTSGSLDTPDLIPTDEFCYPSDPTEFMEKPFSALSWGLDEVSMYEGVSATSDLNKKPALQFVAVPQQNQVTHIQALSPAPMMVETPVVPKSEPLSPSPVPVDMTVPTMRPTTLELSPSPASPVYGSASTTPCSDTSDCSYIDEGILQDYEDQKMKMEIACNKLYIPKGEIYTYLNFALFEVYIVYLVGFSHFDGLVIFTHIVKFTCN